MKTTLAIGWLLYATAQVSTTANTAATAGLIEPIAKIGTAGAVCLALVLLVSKVMPARDAQHAKTIEAIEARHAETVEGICDRFAETVDKAAKQQADTAAAATKQQADTAEVVRNLAVQCQSRRT